MERYCRDEPEDNPYFLLPNKVEACHCKALLVSRRDTSQADYESRPQDEKDAFARELTALCIGRQTSACASPGFVEGSVMLLRPPL
jgi:hypothetical protein